MLKLPQCPTDATPLEFQPGGHFTPSGNSQRVTCPRCQRAGSYLSDSIGNAVLLLEDRAGALDEAAWNEVVFAWVNRVMLVSWRARKSDLEAHRNEEGRRWKEEVFYPKFPEFRDWPETRTFHDLSAEAQALYKLVFGESRQDGAYLAVPPEIAGPVYPPQVPVDFPVTVFYWRRPGSDIEATWTDAARRPLWFMVDPVYSRTLTVPPDPVLVNNTRYFEGVWKSLSQALLTANWKDTDLLGSQWLSERREVKNEYGGLAPWYAFEVNGAFITVGWRKNVVHVGGVAPFSIPIEELEALAKADGVTFSANGTPQRVAVETLSGWDEAGPAVQEHLRNVARKSPDGLFEDEYAPGSNIVVIHAWTQEKVVAYLAILIRAIRSVQRADPAGPNPLSMEVF